MSLGFTIALFVTSLTWRCGQAMEAVFDPDYTVPPITLVSAAFFSLFGLIAACGNAVVIFVFLSHATLRSSSTNMYLASLALSDLIVATLVMPLGIVQHVHAGRWLFGRMLCDLWHATDVCASTASILNLCIIAVERYEAISDPLRHQATSTRRTAARLCGVWLLSAAISYPAIIWWHLRLPEHLVRHQILRPELLDALDCALAHADHNRSTNESVSVAPHVSTTNYTDDSARAHSELLCEFTDDPYYLITSSLISFYAPCTLMIVVYSAVYRTAVRVKNSYTVGSRTVDANATGSASAGSASAGATVVLRVHRGRASPKRVSDTQKTTQQQQPFQRCTQNGRSPLRFRHLVGIKEQIKRVFREQKAAKTLGLIMVVFCVSWTPFFVCNLLIAFQSLDMIREVISKEHEELVMTTVTWLGYASSGLNPFIYGFTLREFRVALLAKIYCCKSQLARKPSLAAQHRTNGSGTCTTRSEPPTISYEAFELQPTAL